MGKINPQKEQLRIMQQINKNVDNKKWRCVIEGCECKAIRSHLLQQHGILDQVAEDGFLVETRVEDFFKWRKDIPPFTFKKISIKNAISLPLFCNTHDTGLFTEIEQSKPDFDLYKHQLLFCLRSAYAELRKKERSLEVYNRYDRSVNLDYDRETLSCQIKGTSLAIKDITEYIKFVTDEIANPNDSFSFYHYEYPVLKVYASGFFSYEKDIEDRYREMEQNQWRIWDAGFVHIIPFEGKTHILFGLHNSHTSNHLKEYMESWNNLKWNELGYYLTELFGARIESWGMGVSLYDKISIKQQKSFFEYIGDNINSYDSNIARFNLFQDVTLDEQ